MLKKCICAFSVKMVVIVSNDTIDRSREVSETCTFFSSSNLYTDSMTIASSLIWFFFLMMITFDISHQHIILNRGLPWPSVAPLRKKKKHKKLHSSQWSMAARTRPNRHPWFIGRGNGYQQVLEVHGYLSKIKSAVISTEWYTRHGVTLCGRTEGLLSTRALKEMSNAVRLGTFKEAPFTTDVAL